MALQTSAEQPIPVRQASQLIAGWIARLGEVWVEGQVAELTRRPGQGLSFLTLRDPSANVSVSVTCPRRVLDAVQPPLVEGARVVVRAKPEVYVGRTSLALAAGEIRHLGVGELLARIERLKAVLAAEGLFAAERKRPLPFLPRVIGLISGRGSAAERDVLENARRRWPAVEFRVESVATQGAYAVTEVTDAIGRLDGDPQVDVIVVARGGGSVEDLLPFSDEGLVRAAAACRTPLVSAIGHEQDSPLLDLVADVRASTPTDAARRLVPDEREERDRITHARRRLHNAVDGRLAAEHAWLRSMRSRPSLADPEAGLAERRDLVRALAARSWRAAAGQVAHAIADVGHTRARVRSLSPQATLDRGYAVVQRRSDGAVVRDPAEAPAGEALRVRLAGGELAAMAVAGAGDAAAPGGGA